VLSLNERRFVGFALSLEDLGVTARALRSAGVVCEIEAEAAGVAIYATHRMVTTTRRVRKPRTKRAQAVVP
jgi:hypothetical protein